MKCYIGKKQKCTILSQKEGGLFTKYINTFLKLKQESSGYPQNVTSEKERQEYIDNYFNHEGIMLDQLTELCTV